MYWYSATKDWGEEQADTVTGTQQPRRSTAVWRWLLDENGEYVTRPTSPSLLDIRIYMESRIVQMVDESAYNLYETIRQRAYDQIVAALGMFDPCELEWYMELMWANFSRENWMARSYKHTPGFTQGEEGTKRFFKRVANKVVRHAEEVDDGNMYKKLGDSYLICDYKWLLHSTEDVVPDHLKPYKIWIK
jgi:hypothetical protein